jgi:hypothetical protein
MTFKRKFGWEFDWYAVDSIGAIALFVCGFTVVPNLIFEDEVKYLKIISYFENLPFFAKAHLSSGYESKKSKSLNGFANQILEAERGIYVFYDKDYSSVYELIAVPEYCINVLVLPDEIQNLLQPLTFNNINFSEIESLDIRKFFECSEGV